MITLAFLSMLAYGAFAQCNCDYTIAPNNAAITFDGATQGVQPGQTICIQAGYHKKITFRNLLGSPTNYIILKNCGGKAEIGGADNLANNEDPLTFRGSRYFRLTGTGDTSIEQGIKILGSKPGRMGIACNGKSSDLEIDHVEITQVGFAGIMAKDDPRCNDYSFDRPNFTMYNISIHDNYIHEIGGEGIYLGNSFFRGTGPRGCTSQIHYPHELRGVKVYNNRIHNTGWEAIQVGSAVADVEVHHNHITNFATENKSSQNGGIQMGLGSTGRVYNNFLKGGTGGVGIEIQGIGENYVYNNIVIDPGSIGVSVNTRSTPLSTDIVDTGYLGGVYIINNTIIRATGKAVRVVNVGPVSYSPGNVIYNNLIVHPDNNWLQFPFQTDWTSSNNIILNNLADAHFINTSQDDYRIFSTSPARNAGQDVSSFGVITDFANQPRPLESVYDAGAFENLTLDSVICQAGNDTTLLASPNAFILPGFASSPNGAIVSYLWEQIAGNQASLTDTNTATLQINGLSEGVYTFRLTATDEQGISASDEITLTILPATPAVMHLVASQGIVIEAGQVSTWQDQVRQNHVTQTSSNQRPILVDSVINGHPAIQFDGNEHLIAANSSDINVGGPYNAKTLVIVFKTGNNVNNRQILWEQGGSTRGLNFYLMNGALYYRGWNLNETSWQASLHQPNITPNTTYVASLQLNASAGTFTAYLNGVKVGQVANVHPLFDHSDTAGFGRLQGSTRFHDQVTNASAYYTGHIAEFYTFNQVLTSEVFLEVHNDLLVKYGLQSPQSPPLPWIDTNVGTVNLAGSVTEVDNFFTLQGSGSDIWGTSDNFYYVYQSLQGDGEIIARVVTQSTTNTWAKTGLMMRETLNGDAKNAYIFLSPFNTSLNFQRRETPGGTTINQHVVTGLTNPYWLKLQRQGNTFTGYRSVDGTNWVLVGSATVAMNQDIYIGLAMISNHGNALGTAEFSDVSVTSGTVYNSRLTNSESNQPSSFIRVYPNPVKKQISLSLSAGTEVYQVHMLNARGKHLGRLPFPSGKIDITGYKAGIYWLQLYTNQGIKTQKIIKID